MRRCSLTTSGVDILKTNQFIFWKTFITLTGNINYIDVMKKNSCYRHTSGKIKKSNL